MKDCPACRGKIQDDALRCKHCGTDLDVMKCPWCAEVIEKDAKKCKHCKSYLDKIVCGSCGKHVDMREMSCGECVNETVAKQVEEKLASEKTKIKLQAWATVIIIVGAAIWVWLNFL